MKFAYPWMLLILIPVLLQMVGIWRRGESRRALDYGTLDAVTQAGISWRQRFSWLPPALRIAGLAALVVALGRPQLAIAHSRQEEEGIAIEMLLDLSSSMTTPFDDRGKPSTRLDAAKKVLTNFVLGNGKNLTGRPHDLIGLITFARYADTVCPMTLAHHALVAMVQDLVLGDRPNEDGTAYGDAIDLAAARLKTLEEAQSHSGGKQAPIKTKVIVLLTDGENNSGEYLPLQAAALAKKWGIRIYAIMLAGDDLAPAPAVQSNVPTPLSDAEQTMRGMAAMTGGLFHRANDYNSLESIYAKIDSLEKSKVSIVRFTDDVDLFAWFALPGFCLIVAEQLLRHLVLRRVP